MPPRTSCLPTGIVRRGRKYAGRIEHLGKERWTKPCLTIREAVVQYAILKRDIDKEREEYVRLYPESEMVMRNATISSQKTADMASLPSDDEVFELLDAEYMNSTLTCLPASSSESSSSLPSPHHQKKHTNLPQNIRICKTRHGKVRYFGSFVYERKRHSTKEFKTVEEAVKELELLKRTTMADSATSFKMLVIDDSDVLTISDDSDATNNDSVCEDTYQDVYETSFNDCDSCDDGISNESQSSSSSLSNELEVMVRDVFQQAKKKISRLKKRINNATKRLDKLLEQDEVLAGDIGSSKDDFQNKLIEYFGLEDAYIYVVGYYGTKSSIHPIGGKIVAPMFFGKRIFLNEDDARTVVRIHPVISTELKCGNMVRLPVMYIPIEMRRWMKKPFAFEDLETSIDMSKEQAKKGLPSSLGHGYYHVTLNDLS